MPPAILNAIETEPAPAEHRGSRIREHFVLLANGIALEAAAAAAERRGFIAEIATDIADQPIEEGCEQLLRRLQALRTKHRDSSSASCLISGGEFACPVRGKGTGGRNLETALRL